MFIVRCTERLINRGILSILSIPCIQGILYKRGNLISFMVGDDCQPKIKRDLKEELDELKFVMRKKSLSEVVETLFLFYKAHKKEFKEWNKEIKK